MLAKDYAVFLQRLAALEVTFEDYLVSCGYKGHQRHKRWHSFEGLLSATWQSWGSFTRSVFLKSCMGTTTRDGQTTDAVPDGVSVGSWRTL